MKKITKIYNYLDQEEAQAIRVFIAQSGRSLAEWAQALGVTKGHFSNVLAGRKAFTDDLRQRFANIGIRII